MNKKTQIIAVVALIYVLIAAGILSLVLYRISSSGQALTQRVDTIADRNARTRVYKDLSSVVNNSAQERQELSSYILTEDQTSSFLTNIESIGSAQGVHITTNSLHVVQQDKAFVNQLVVQFSVNGKEAAVKKMLTIFETLPYHSEVSSFSFTRTDTGMVNSTVELTISLLKHA